MKTSALLARFFSWPTILLPCWQLFMTPTFAATVLSGNVSGTWTTNQSPYILSANCIVASNQTLTIQPGVTVIIGPSVALYSYGGILAIGTPELPIKIRGTGPTNYWEIIRMFYSGFTNRFNYCQVSDANSPALEFDVDGPYTMQAEVLNCDFSNCLNGGVLGAANANGPILGAATISLEVHNSVFTSTSYGCYLLANSGVATGRITGNVFRSMNRNAFYLQGTGTNISLPVFENNTVANVNQGVVVSGPFEPLVRGNVFLRNSKAIVGGETNVAFNCFFQNTTDFFGYPFIYGYLFQNNHNGDPCDAFFNIFLDPRLLDTNRFLLSNASPCIDAGDPAIADVCFQFSHGSAISDIGAYGGPDACGWLTHGFAPVLLEAPAGQSSCVGGSATFKVRVDGSSPLSYRWYFNGNLLAGEINAQLSVVNLQTNQAGLYSVAVSNVFGSVTSAFAPLLVFDACVGIDLYAGLSITGMVGRTYKIESATNLSATAWTLVATNTLTQPRWLFIDTNTPFNPGTYFRVRLQP